MRTPALSPPSAAKSSTAAAPAAAGTLPLNLPTGNASQVITVVASSASATTAVLQAWDATSGGWVAHGPSITAHVGGAGVGHASEGSTRTPAGSFTLTQAFGHDANPATSLPYFQTTPADWWISQSGALYNTHQNCASGCAFSQGDPNEHLYYETPYYNYAVVIDYNTGPVVQGAGSAFFLHVTDGTPTAGCVAVPQATLVTIMQWLSPAAHPRILIGVG
ncbi:MAG: L,D-transpeptidase family protein [Actinobacteria bacterium]|nr:L,D-transpeptidase family protein [Actinomycetota bacterium]